MKDETKKVRKLHGHHRPTPAQLMMDVARWCEAHDVGWDSYGSGAVIEEFESHVANLLGFEAARFFPSGKMAQVIALRVWSDQAGIHHVGMHPTSHLELHEARAYAHLHGLRATLLGPRERPLTARDVDAFPERLSALLTELPLREMGSQLPSWADVVALKASAQRRGMKLHLDGARLWTCAPFYERDYAEICAGFDSVYVSFYKDIGALSGAMLLGPRTFIDSCKVWQRRHGGTLHSLLPNVVSARMLLDTRLAKIPRYVAHARAVAAAIARVPDLQVLPDPPHTNMFHVLLPIAPRAAIAGRKRVVETLGVSLFGHGGPGWHPDTSRVEMWIGDAALEVDPREAEQGFRALLEG